MKLAFTFKIIIKGKEKLGVNNKVNKKVNLMTLCKVKKTFIIQVLIYSITFFSKHYNHHWIILDLVKTLQNWE